MYEIKVEPAFKADYARVSHDYPTLVKRKKRSGRSR